MTNTAKAEDLGYRVIAPNPRVKCADCTHYPGAPDLFCRQGNKHATCSVRQCLGYYRTPEWLL